LHDVSFRHFIFVLSGKYSFAMVVASKVVASFRVICPYDVGKNYPPQKELHEWMKGQVDFGVFVPSGKNDRPRFIRWAFCRRDALSIARMRVACWPSLVPSYASSFAYAPRYDERYTRAGSWRDCMQVVPFLVPSLRARRAGCGDSPRQASDVLLPYIARTVLRLCATQ